MSTEIAIIKNALASARVKDVPDAAVESAAGFMLLELFTLAGQVPDLKDAEVLLKQFAHDLPDRFPALTLNEVKIALGKGIRGDYGEYFGINVVSINKWLKAYMESSERAEAVREQRRPYLPQRAEWTDAEKDACLAAAYDRCLTKYRKTGVIHDAGNAVYDWLDSKGKIRLTRELKGELYDKARRMLLSKAKTTAAKTPADRRIPVKVLIEEIESSKAGERVTALAKRLALAVVFDKINGNNFNELNKTENA
jgi:hypothetical protein